MSDYATWADYVAVWQRHGAQDAWRFARDNLTGSDLEAARRLHERPADHSRMTGRRPVFASGSLKRHLA